MENDAFKPMMETTNKPGTEFCDLVIMSEKKDSEEMVSAVKKVPMISPEELEDIKKKAFDEAYQDGLEKIVNDISDKTKQLDDLIQLMKLPIALIDEQVQAEVIQLSTWIAKTILNAELSINPEKIMAIFDEVKSLLPNMNQLKALYLSVEDHKVMNQYYQDDSLDFALKYIQSDPVLSRGEYRLDLLETEVDASIEARVHELVINVLGSGDTINE